MKKGLPFFAVSFMISLMGCIEEERLVGDLCPDDDLKVKPGICGCGVPDVDADGDGAFACYDACEEDPMKTQAGVCGCGVPDVDADGDGVLDCEDACPLDGSKTEVGVCGCGVPDVDSDGDGVLDCEDACPQDSAKQAVGVCGCGVEDIGQNLGDDDGDGVVNCLDLCPDNPVKSEPGKNGCAAMDSDGDGVEDDDDYCPHNPNIMQNDGRDCNYNADGEFEIWSASDFKRLQAELEARVIPKHRPGFACDTLGSVLCAEADVSGRISVCADWSGAKVYVEGACAEGDVCGLDEGDVYACIHSSSASTCTEGNGDPVAGNCCDASWTQVCQDDQVMSCVDGKLVETACAYGCLDAYSCASCHAVDAPTQAGDCCDGSWTPVCSDNKQWICTDGKLTETSCAYGCGEDGVCLSCRTTEVPKQEGDCCTSATFVDRCDGSGMLACVRGRVERQECWNTCYAQADGEGVACAARGTEEISYFKVKLMRDIDMHEAVSCQWMANAFVGNWHALDLYRVDLDGQGHSIRFTGNKLNEDGRCGLTRPLFDQVIESNIYDLKLDIDIRGASEGALARFVSHSRVSGVTWDGSVVLGKSLLGESNPRGTGLIATSAQYSYFENVGMRGTVEIQQGSYYGLIANMSNSRVHDVHVDLEKVQLPETSNQSSGVLGSIGANSVITDVDVKISELELGSPITPGMTLYFSGIFNTSAGHSINHPVELHRLKVDMSSIQYVGGYTFRQDPNYMGNSNNYYISGIGHQSGAKISQVEVSVKGGWNKNMDRTDFEFSELFGEDGVYEYNYINIMSGFYVLNSTSEVSDFKSSIQDIAPKMTTLIEWLKTVDEDMLMDWMDNYCYEVAVTSNWNVIGLAHTLNGKVSDIDVRFEDIESESIYSNCYCGCISVGSSVSLYGMNLYNSAQVTNGNISMQQLEANNIYGVGNYHYTASRVSDVDILMNDIQCDAFMGVTRSQYGHATDLKMTLNRVNSKGVFYSLASTIGSAGRFENVRIMGDDIRGSNLYFIANSISSGSASNLASNLALNDINVQFTNAHADVRAFALDVINSYREIRNIAVYADVYAKKQTSSSGESSFVRYLSNSNSSYPIRIQNVASSMRLKRYTSYTDTDGVRSYHLDNSGSMPHFVSNYNVLGNSNYYQFSNAYWMRRSDSDIGSPYLDGYMHGFRAVDTPQTVANLNAVGTGVTWTSKTFVEDGVSILVPMIVED